MEDDIHWQWPIDSLTLILIVLAGFQLGLLGLFNIDFISWLFGGWQLRVYDLIGFAAVWQLCRQRFL
jgi:uncharacterized membrane protein YuzA (DUF378 family)